jgi:hypothetical protein
MGLRPSQLAWPFYAAGEKSVSHGEHELSITLRADTARESLDCKLIPPAPVSIGWRGQRCNVRRFRPLFTALAPLGRVPQQTRADA